jgi:hypothetical protein
MSHPHPRDCLAEAIADQGIPQLVEVLKEVDTEEDGYPHDDEDPDDDDDDDGEGDERKEHEMAEKFKEDHHKEFVNTAQQWFESSSFAQRAPKKVNPLLELRRFLMEVMDYYYPFDQTTWRLTARGILTHYFYIQMEVNQLLCCRVTFTLLSCAVIHSNFANIPGFTLFMKVKKAIREKVAFDAVATMARSELFVAFNTRTKTSQQAKTEQITW